MARITWTMARVAAMDTSSMAKAILNRIMDSKTTGKEAVSSSKMDMGDRTRVTRPDIKKPIARRIDNMTNEANSDQAEEDTRSNPMGMVMEEMAMPTDSTTKLACRIVSMILATSNDQTEVDRHHRIVQDRKGRQIRIIEVDQGLMHSCLCQIKTTEVNHLTPKGLIREMALLVHGPVTKANPQNETNRIQEMATGSKGLPEIGQSNDRLRRNRMADLTRSSNHDRIPRKAQWKSGKRRRRPECMRLLTNLR